MYILLVIFAVSVGGDLVNFKGQCRLDPNPSVEYRCILTGASEGSRPCGASEPAGTIVSPKCRKPNYYAATPLTFMRCFDGYWDYVARCSPECGRVTPDGKGLVVGGTVVKRGELPWHAGIYNTGTNPYMQICGGSLISNNVVLSAAHCFWTDLEKQLPASKFSVAVGKLYRPWNDQKDEAQKSKVKVIHLPPRYQGASANFQDDIAVVIVAQEFQFRTYIRPVCLSFDYHFAQQQLYSGNKGKVAGWGLTAANGKASPVLQVVDLPYVEVGTCINRSPVDFREYITSDKICAGTLESNSALCKGDSGGGLAFPESIRGIERYYLRGVVSTAPTSENACNTDTYTSFTSIMKHEHFIKQFWSETGQFKCQDGSFITAANYCDGSKECPDGSDETAWACSAKICSSYLFQCAYGACVDRGATCNGVSECADGSDETDELCGGLGIVSSTELIVQQAVGLSTRYPQNSTMGFNSPPITGISTGGQAGSKFRNDYTYYPRLGGYIKVHPVAAEWETASHICKYEGAEIATPTSPEMLAIIKELVSSSKPKLSVYYAGLRQTLGIHATGPINGIPIESLQNNWEVNSKASQQCIGYSDNGTVWDYSCSHRLPYMCFRMYFDTDSLTECGTVDRAYSLDSESGLCYKLHTGGEVWERALVACRAEGGALAAPSAATVRVLRSLAGEALAGPLAIGYREWGADNSWWTLHGKTLAEAGFQDWSTNRPTPPHPEEKNIRKSCGGLTNGQLVDIYCYVPYPFICEKTKESLINSKEDCGANGSTGFVETLTPQYTPGQSITSPQPTSVEDKLANLQAQQEITQLKAEVEDLKEKLETIKVRRADDREKLRELERVRLALEQANEFKSKIMESQAQLQRDLQRAKQETREAQEAYEAHMEETAELAEAAEMAALDKEMAEERSEALQMELENCREKLEEATLDLQLMRAEMEAGGNIQHPYSASEGATGYETRQLQQQNARMRDTLVRLRDLTAHDKHEMQKMHKDLDQYKSEIAELSRTKEKLSSRVEELEAQVADLREQVDAALGAEEMVEQLAEKKMGLEDQVEQLKQDVSELEALQEVHEQLVESNRELEMDLREELEMAHAATRESIREREAALETIIDRDSTITKFRELVHKMTEQYNELKTQIDSKDSTSISEQDTSTSEPRVTMELGSLVAASRACTRSVDLQLRALELSQARARADMLAACLPEHFMHTAGDHDAILLILLMQRLNTKADIILGQIRERFPAVNVWDTEVVTKSHTAAQYSFRCQLEYQLHMIQCYVSMWTTALDTCPPELLLRCASALPDALQQERALDATASLLKSNELDENCSPDGLERCWTYLSAMWSGLNLTAVSGAYACRSGVLHACCALDALSRALHADAQALTHILLPSDRTQELGQLHESICTSSSALQQQLKGIRRRLPPGAQLSAVPLDPQLLERLRGDSARSLWTCARAVSLAARGAAACASAAGERGEPAPLAHAQLNNVWCAAVDKLYHQDDHGPVRTIKHALSAVSGDVTKLAAFAHDNEYDMMSRDNQPAEKVTPPVVLRAQLVKKQLEETKSLTIRLENKEADIKELRKALKAKQEELSEMQIRRELGERKLVTAARDLELRAEQLQRKLEDAQNQLKRKEKEFEETMDHLQQDIDSLENERGALRDKLKLYAKRGGTHHAVAPSTPTIRDLILSPVVTSIPKEPAPQETPVKITPGVAAGEVNEALQQQLKVLSWTLERERGARVAACRRAESAAIRSLRPLERPTAAAAVARRQAHAMLEKKTLELQSEWTMFVARSGLMQFPKEPSQYARALKQHKEKQREIKKQLEDRLSELQAEAKRQLLIHRPWRCVDADFAQFPKPELSAALTQESLELGTIQYPAPADAQNDDTIYVTPTQLANIRDLVGELKSDDVKLELRPLDTVCAA